MNTIRDFITLDMFVKLHAIGREGDKASKSLENVKKLNIDKTHEVILEKSIQQYHTDTSLLYKKGIPKSETTKNKIHGTLKHQQA